MQCEKIKPGGQECVAHIALAEVVTAKRSGYESPRVESADQLPGVEVSLAMGAPADNAPQLFSTITAAGQPLWQPEGWM